MADRGSTASLVPHEDEHQNEYLPAANDRLAWATGFTGSAGAAVILKDKAGDLRRRPLHPAGPRPGGSRRPSRSATWSRAASPAYLESAAKPGQAIGYDPRLHSPDALDRLKAAAARPARS